MWNEFTHSILIKLSIFILHWTNRIIENLLALIIIVKFSSACRLGLRQFVVVPSFSRSTFSYLLQVLRYGIT